MKTQNCLQSFTFVVQKQVKKAIMNHHPHSYPQFSNGPNLTLKKVIGLTEAHQDKFWTKLLPFLNQLQVGLEILDNLASTYQQGQNIISVWTQKRFKKKDRTHQKKKKEKKRKMELKNYSSQECMWVWHGSVSVLRSTRFSLIMASWGTMLVFYASLYPNTTRFTFIEALKKYGLCLLFHLNSPFSPTVTDCSGFTLFSQRHN